MAIERRPGGPASLNGREISVTLDQLVVRLGKFELGPICLELRKGEIFCLVGANGAGKTTLLLALVGLISPTSGAAQVLGESSAGRSSALLRGLGFVPDDPNDLLGELTAEELWELHAMAQARLGGSLSGGRANAQRLAERLGFVPPPQLSGTYSYGMRKKTQTVASLLHDPAVIVMDEPRNALDPLAAARLEHLLVELRSEGRTLILSTHDLAFAESIADRVGILRDGQLVALGTVEEIATASGGSFSQSVLRLLEKSGD